MNLISITIYSVKSYLSSCWIVMNYQLQIKSDEVDYEIDVEGVTSLSEDIKMEIVDANNFVDCKFKVDCELNNFPLKKEGGDPTKYSQARSIMTTQTQRLEPEPILYRKRLHSSKIICIQGDQKIYKCIGCGEISTDLKAHIEEKHKDVGNDVIIHAMKSQCDWCGLKNSELKYFNFSFSDVKYVKSCQQSLNLAIDLKKPSSQEVIMMDSAR